jgi:hypothetical protein
VEKREAVERLRSGDIGGLEALVRGHQIRALRAAYLITRDRASTEDGWLRALRSEGYAARIQGRPEALQQTLFPYLEAL